MHRFRSLSSIVALACFALALHAQDGLSDALARAGSASNAGSALFGPSLVTADFNNDHHPDGALLLRARNAFHIELHFRFHQVSEITFASSAPRLAIYVLDVNRDGAPDLLVVDPFSLRRLFVWLNDGHGAFYQARVDDFRTGEDQCRLSVALSCNGPEYAAIAGKDKMRSRCSPPESRRIPFETRDPNHIAELDRPLPVWDAEPNPLRGPPAYASL
jgi:hypothetical protein